MKKRTQKDMPVNNVKWVHRDTLNPNNYNPNRVAPPELKLLEISIVEDGWTQPIVVNSDMTIVDGYHRWRVSGEESVYSITGGKVPVVVLEPTDAGHQKMSTIRHNRARGTHAVLSMSEIVQQLVEDEGLSGKEIMERLQMEEEEVARLLMRSGIPKSDVFEDSGFSQAWVPE